ncbi:dTDP-4-dehydrorhamnose reductase [Granulosicoccus antarcticus IMCC3135]|uniref:dTDP-4-dehydrorhamnose reductase n=2 Tax=Granulosicoccus TaxID=437504 RepID=A0A2Z2NVN2_9GAMM|nr:dTDP-4-dehydrorhamnose reductase [Granulosicoccus antarcticus IMCC3135]
MLGNAVLRLFEQSSGYLVFGSVRSHSAAGLLPQSVKRRLVACIDVENFDSLAGLFSQTNPQIVINCIGLVKQKAEAADPLLALPINSILPHRLARLCAVAGARLIHISTDCVFSGTRGMYTEGDFPDATDMYGRTKFLGEVDYPHAVTLRTSIIGQELQEARSLVSWFLAQNGEVKGYQSAIFSGLPTLEVGRVIRDYVIPNPQLQGLYHVSAEPINKFDLLMLLARVYQKEINIVPDNTLVINRSLDSSLFRKSVGYTPSSWPELVSSMQQFG